MALPLTLSFYVFQALTYTIDIYRGDAKGTKSYLAHLAAVSFFPTTLAGPITRVSSLIDQFEKRKPLDPADGGRALFLIGMGLMKKLLIADYLSSNLVNRVFDFPTLYTGAETLIAVYAYALQIYYDFSGYTDIAMGSALLLGIKLPPNFNRPYAAENIADFWRRWHISLSNWLRDYLYFSLPGKRSKIFSYVNLVITMVIGGLWHGANWNFVIWGALHGFGLAFVRLWQTQSGAAKTADSSPLLALCQHCAHLPLRHISPGFFSARPASMPLWRFSAASRPSAYLSRIYRDRCCWCSLIGALAHYVPKKWYDWSLNLYVEAPFYAQAGGPGAAGAGLAKRGPKRRRAIHIHQILMRPEIPVKTTLTVLTFVALLLVPQAFPSLSNYMSIEPKSAASRFDFPGEARACRGAESIRSPPPAT